MSETPFSPENWRICRLRMRGNVLTRLVVIMPNSDAPLINPTWEEIVARDPLVSFSWYLSGRKNVLLHFGDEILANLDAGFHESQVKMNSVDRVESLMWLWILGAYEIIRTMHQARSCFAPRVHRPLADLKAKLAAVRMPAAKMEKRGKNEPVTSNRSPCDMDLASKDILLGDPEAPIVSARDLIQEFRLLVDPLVPADILHGHEDAYKNET